MALVFAATSEPRQLQAEGLTNFGTVTFDTEKQFDGRSCWKCAKGAENRFNRALTTSLGTTYYFRFPVRLSSVAPSANFGLLRISAAASIELTLTTGGKINLWNALKSANIVENTFAPEVEKTYVMEVKVLVPAAGSGTAALRIYSDTGATLYESGDKTVEIGTTAISTAAFGHVGTDTNCDVYVSHVAIGDSTGASRNSWQGFEKLVELQPIEDGANTGWAVPGGATTNLWKALDNRPPTGIAASTLVADAEKMIRDANSNATDTYVAVLGAYTTALGSGGGGIGVGDAINFTQAQARGASGSTTARELAVRSESNPGTDASEGTVSTGTTAAGTEPTGWTTVFGSVNYSPTVTRTAKPQVRVRKGTASTTAMLYDLVRLVVGYVPSTLTTKTLADSVAVSDAIVKQPGKGLADTAPTADSVAKASTKLLADAAALADAVLKAAAKLLADTAGTSDAVAKGPRKLGADTASVSDGIVKKAIKAFADTATVGDAVEALRLRVLALADSVSLSDAFAKRPTKATADTAAVSDSTVKKATKASADTVGLTDGLVKNAHKVLADGVSVVDVLKTKLKQAVGYYLRVAGKWVKVK